MGCAASNLDVDMREPQHHGTSTSNKISPIKKNEQRNKSTTMSFSTTATTNSARRNHTSSSLPGFASGMMEQMQQMQQRQLAKQQEMMQTNPTYRQMIENQQKLSTKIIEAMSKGDSEQVQNLQRELFELNSKPENMAFLAEMVSDIRATTTTTSGKKGKRTRTTSHGAPSKKRSNTNTMFGGDATNTQTDSSTGGDTMNGMFQSFFNATATGGTNTTTHAYSGTTSESNGLFGGGGTCFGSGNTGGGGGFSGGDTGGFSGGGGADTGGCASNNDYSCGGGGYNDDD